MSEASSPKKGIAKINGSTAVASTTGGIALLLNVGLKFLGLPQDQYTDLLNITPILAAFIAWVITSLYTAYGVDPERIKFERMIEKCLKQCEKDLNDPHILDSQKEIVKREYNELRAQLRDPNLISNLRKTSNQG